MDDVIKLYWDLRKMASDHGREIANAIGVQPHQHPAKFFSMTFNNFTFTLEVLSYYHTEWSKANISRAPSIDIAKKQNAERIILLQKRSFIEMMSIFEFCAKETVRNNNKLFANINKGRVYLSRIMQESHDKGILTNKELTLWTGAIHLRNSLVHNNGISEESATFSFPTVTLTVTENIMLQGNLKTFSEISRWVLDASKQWIRATN